MPLGRPRSRSSPTRPTQPSRWRRGPAPTCTPTAATATPTSGGGAVASAAAVSGSRSPSMKAVGVRPTRGDFALPDVRHHQAGRPVREHPVLPHGQVRPRSDAAHRLRTAGRGGPEAHRGEWIAGTAATGGERPERTTCCDLAPGAARDQLLATDSAVVSAGHVAEARGRRAEARRARAVAGRGREAPGRPGSRPVRGLPARGRENGASSARTPGPGRILALTGGRRPGREAVLVAGRSTAAVATRSATAARRRAGPVGHRQAAVARETCWRASWSRRGGSSRSTRRISSAHRTAARSPACWSGVTPTRSCCATIRTRRLESRSKTWRPSSRPVTR